jgi:ubiquinone/menaquinone biosynthesis C-methylase UbiE
MATDKEVQRLRGGYRNYSDLSLSELRWSEINLGNQAMLLEKNRILRQVLVNHNFFPLMDRKILDIGCGTGQILSSLLSWGALPVNLFGVDLLNDHIIKAKRKLPGIFFQVGNAEHLSFQNNTLDLLMVFTVFSSILDAGIAANMAGEINQVLKQDRAVIWYDFIHNNHYNSNVRGITRQNITALFLGYQLYLTRITLLPFIARRLKGFTNLIYPILAAIPWLRTHYLGIMRKPRINN